MSSPEITFSFLNLSPSSWRSTSSKCPPLTSRPSFNHLSIPVAPRLWPPQPFADAWQHLERARFPICQAWQIASPLNVTNNSRLPTAMLVSLHGGKASPWGSTAWVGVAWGGGSTDWGMGSMLGQWPCSKGHSWVKCGTVKKITDNSGSDHLF